VFAMAESYHHTQQVNRGIEHLIKMYLKIDTNTMLMRSNDSDLIRDLILKINLLSNNLVYKQERDAFLWFLNEELYTFMYSPFKGNATWDIKAEFTIRIAAAVIINYLYVDTPSYKINRHDNENRRGPLVRAMRNKFREIIDNEFLVLNHEDVNVKFLRLQQYETQVIQAVRQQYSIEYAKLFHTNFIGRERRSVDKRHFNIIPQHIDEAVAYYPEQLTLTQAEIEASKLPNLHIQTYDLT